MKPDPPPIIDLAGTVRIIDDAQDPPRWITIDSIFPAESTPEAIRILKRHGLSCGWVFDGLGNKRFVRVG